MWRRGGKGREEREGEREKVGERKRDKGELEGEKKGRSKRRRGGGRGGKKEEVEKGEWTIILMMAARQCGGYLCAQSSRELFCTAVE